VRLHAVGGYKSAVAAEGNGNGIPAGRRSLNGEALVGVCRSPVRSAWVKGPSAPRSSAARLPSYRFGVQRRVRVADVRNWIAAHRVRE
jgi:hypothetical protein